MSVSAQRAQISLAFQPGKVGNGNTFDPSGYDFQKFLAMNVQMGTAEEQAAMNGQVGGPLTPTGQYKVSYMVGGQFDMYAHLENILPFILKGFLGASSVATGVSIAGTSITGLNTHTFKFNADQSIQPWMCFRALIPGTTPWGEHYYDCKINSIVVNVPAKGKVTTRVAFEGRDYVGASNPAWTYENADFDTGNSAPDAGNGVVKFGTTVLPLQGLQITFAGQSSAQQENVIGQFTLDDIIRLGVMVQIKTAYKWADAALANRIRNGGSAGTTFSPLPFSQDTAGSDNAVDILFRAPVNVVGSSPATPFAMSIQGARAVWEVDGPPQLAGGALISQGYTITLHEPAAGADYVKVLIQNGQNTAY